MHLIYPALFIGKNTFHLFQSLGFHLLGLEGDIKDRLDELLISEPRDIALYDYSNLKGNQKSIILKFIEDYKGRVAIYSSEDCFSEIVLSRFLLIKKDISEVQFEPDSIEQKIVGSSSLFPSYMMGNSLSRKILRNMK